MAGNFHASSRNVRLEYGTIFVAECADVEGHHHQSENDLNECIISDFGCLKCARGGNFGASAREIRLEDYGRCLEADLGDGRGGRAGDRICLDERISNDNGRLVMI